MRDIISEVHNFAKANNALEKGAIRLEALEAADKQMCAEHPQANTMPSSQFSVLREKYFRVEAAKRGMTPTEIDNHWHVALETQTIVDSLKSHAPTDEMNQKLRDVYSNVWAGLHALSNHEKLSSPLLIKVPDAYGCLKLKILFVGQQTQGWCGLLKEVAPIENLMFAYEGFLREEVAGKSGPRRPFFRAIRELMTKLNGESCEDGVVWSNVYTMDQDKKMPEPHALREAILKLGILSKQVEILKPEAIIFLTGHYYDTVIEQWIFPDYSFVDVGGRPQKQMAQLKHRSTGKRKPYYRIHHPGYLARQGNEEFTMMLSDVAELIKRDRLHGLEDG